MNCELMLTYHTPTYMFNVYKNQLSRQTGSTISDRSKNATHNMVYIYDACDQISDFCHQQILRKMRRKISWTDGRTDRGKTVYPPPPPGSRGITKQSMQFCNRHTFSLSHSSSWERGRRGRMVVEFTTTCVISAYHH